MTLILNCRSRPFPMTEWEAPAIIPILPFPEIRRSANRFGMARTDGAQQVQGCQVNPGEIVFEVTEAVEGGYDARALGYGIFTQGGDWDNLKEMARDTVICHFDADSAPRTIRLRIVVREEVIKV